ncbi:MAG: hypothetical protein EPO01_07580 [Aquabacterium sp.]|nr:MAG: hypothetical protein EPO12_13570 [Aquabacterium sp.]TAL23273.1 MAG: hypothetical protein EPO01_07580 [Aquabacterium sp.]
MKLNKAYRRWIASVLAAVLVCLQLITAAYACPFPQAALSLQASAEHVQMADMPGCQGMIAPDEQQPQLCKAHCDRDKQSVNTVPAVDPVVSPSVDVLVTRLAGWSDAVVARPLQLPAVIDAHSRPPDGAPAVYLRLQVLRN